MNFKSLVAAALAVASFGAFADDISLTTLTVISAPAADSTVIGGVVEPLLDTTNTLTNNSAVIQQLGTSTNVTAVIDQNGSTTSLAWIYQDNTNGTNAGAVAYIQQAGATNAKAVILQR
ncbi:MAG: hypothetical protein JOY60_08160 [Burkholderiaceae bacterium]|nr:hypothetical protein [Roseateles sp.]MBV8469816.1 hypothetical protein [Burkholderiaceae bacterium]